MGFGDPISGRLWRAVGKQAIWLALGLALLFAAVAGAQYWFVQRQVFKTARMELTDYAKQIVTEVGYRNPAASANAAALVVFG